MRSLCIIVVLGAALLSAACRDSSTKKAPVPAATTTATAAATGATSETGGLTDTGPMPRTVVTPARATNPTPPLKKTRTPIGDDEKAKRSQVGVKFVGIKETPGPDGKPGYQIDIEVTNLSAKDIKTYQGSLRFLNGAGDTVYLLGWTKGPLKAGETRKDNFMPLFIENKAVSQLKMGPDQVKAAFEASSITFADGTVKKF